MSITQAVEEQELSDHEARKAAAIRLLRDWAEQHEIPWTPSPPARVPVA